MAEGRRSEDSCDLCGHSRGDHTAGGRCDALSTCYCTRFVEPETADSFNEVTGHGSAATRDAAPMVEGLLAAANELAMMAVEARDRQRAEKLSLASAHLHGVVVELEALDA